MKKVGTLVGIMVLAISVGSLISWVNNENEPEMTRIEVIRSQNGELSMHDTLVPVGSDYSAQDYLDDLGFGNDESVIIMNMNGQDGEMEVEIESTQNEGEEVHEIRIEKQLTIDENNSIDEQIWIEGDEQINLDSILAIHGIEGDSGEVRMHKVVIMTTEDGQGFHESIDQEGAVFYHSSDEGGTHNEMAIYGDEDFTLVIVSEGGLPSAARSQIINDAINPTPNDVKLFPNPADKIVRLSFEFEQKANTSIEVLDMNGKVVMQLILGDFSGDFSKDLDVSSWKTGVYLVNVNHGGEISTSKLIVQ